MSDFLYLVSVAARAFFGTVGINRHGAIALRIAPGLIGLRVASFVEVTTRRITARLVALFGQVALV
jgi:hypothetical protein